MSTPAATPPVWNVRMGQLRAGLADRLGGDDADRLTRPDHLAGGEVAAVARPADAVTGLAGEG